MKYFFNYISTVFLFVLLGISSGASAHSVQVGYCVSCTGELTLYVEHWHGNANPNSTTMTLELNINGVISTVTGSPAANIHTTFANLPGCANPVNIFASCPGLANTEDDWVVYNFPNLPCGVPVTIKIISGNSAFTQDGCNMYPATTPVIIVPCTTHPPPVAANDQNICGNLDSAILTLTGFIAAIQWQQAPAYNGPWTNIPGATTTPFHTGPLSATTYYRALESGGCESNVVTITKINAPISNAGVDILSCQTNTSGNLGAPSTPGYTYSWSPGVGLSDSTIANPTVVLNSPGTNNYTITTTGLGCFSTDNVVVTVNPLPTATISGTIATCETAPPPNITFTGAGGTPPYTFTYAINGGANQTVITTGGNSVTVVAPTIIPGTFIYSLVSVQESSSTTCSQLQTGAATITIDPLPTATIAGTIAVCKNDVAPNITFTGATGTAPYTFSFTINSGPVATITTTSGSTVTIPAPTTTAGVFTYSLLSVFDASSSACSQTQNGSVTVTVNPLPIASIAGTIAVCNNSTAPDITFTGAGGTAPYTFTYTINNGTNQTVVTTGGNSVTVPVPTTTVGSFVYALISVQDASSTNCSQLQSGTATVTVNPQPTATIAGTTAVCRYANMPNITFIGGASTPPYTFTYTINGGPNLTVSTSIGDSVTVAVPTGSIGTFVYDLVSVHDGSATACSQSQYGSATVIVNPLPVANFGLQNECLHQPVNFTDLSSVSSGAVTKWSWNFGNNSPIDTLQNPTYTYTTANTYTVTLIVTTNNGCKDTISKNDVIHPLPHVQYNTANVCDDSIIYFNDLSTITATDTMQSWKWNFGDNSPLSINQNTNHLYALPGSYLVKLVVVSNFGCSDSITKKVYINPNPVVDFSVNDTAGCSPECVSFTNLSTILTGNNATLLWGFGDGSGGSDANHCYVNDTVIIPYYFNISLTVASDSGCTSFLTKNNLITVYPNPQAAFTARPELTTIEDPVISISNTTIGGYFWNWNMGEGAAAQPPGSDTSTSYTPSPHTYQNVGVYTITLVTTSPYGCVDSTHQSIDIEPDFAFFIPNSFTPNDDGNNDTFNGKGIFIDKYEMMIFDRWGNLIFFTDNLNKGWGGKANHGAEMAQQDEYVYVVKLIDFRGRTHNYRGIVSIVR